MTPSDRKYLNQNFVIRLETQTIKTLVGAGQLYKHLEQRHILRLVNDLKHSQEYKHTYKFRRGLKLEFISK